MLLFDRAYGLSSRLAVWKIEESEDTLLQLFPEKQNDYLVELAHYKHAGKRVEYLTVRVLLKYMLGRECIVLHDADGRPSLADSPLNISISHTNNYVAVMLSEQCAVGVDIEMKRDKVLRLKHMYMSEEEIRNVDTTHELESLLIHWSVKETIFKVASTPLPDFKDQIHIEPFSITSEDSSLLVREVESGKVYHVGYQIGEDFVLTYTVGN